MPAALFILARSDDEWWIKLIPFAIILVIWGLGALASAFKKSRESDRLSSWERPVPWAPAEPDWARDDAAEVTAPRPPLPPLPRDKAKGGRRRSRSVAPPPLPMPPSRASDVPASQVVPGGVAGRRPAPAAPTAASIRSWLTPQVLRSQYVVTEIFDPPAALREPRGGLEPHD